jgi:SAM-dependent methyltransferase
VARRRLPPLAANAWLRWDRIAASLESIRPHSADRPLGDILEIGVGQGGVASRLALRGRYVGVDLDATSLSTARTRLKSVGAADAQLFEGSLDEVLAPEDRFDVVCAFEVLEHIEDDLAAVRAWSARLRPGGTLLMSVPANPARYGAWDQMVGHYRRYTTRTLGSVLESAGLEHLVIEHYGAGLGTALEHGRNLIASRRGFRPTPPAAPDPRAAREVIDENSTAGFAAATRASGRALQPPAALGFATEIGTLPFRRLQKFTTTRGTGLVASARAPF